MITVNFPGSTIDVSLLRRDAETEAPAEVIEVPAAPTTEPAPTLPRPPDQARSGSPETVAEKPVRPVVSLDEAAVQAIKSMLDQQSDGDATPRCGRSRGR